ncbi:MAG TPA: amidohydrolase [Nocardioidaceae bacterium]|nr:amidohydrolase [Nocardioidaceae bacterium]
MDRPDVVFAGGRIFAADGRAAFDGAVAVRDGRIVAVGGDEVRDLAGPGTRVVDLAGGLLLPGFVDAHTHPVQGGLERLRCDLTEFDTREAYLDAIRTYAEANADAEWITGGGWSMAAFDGGWPQAAELDAIVPDRPVFLPNRDHHGAWANSRALALAGIDATTPDPADGRLERDTDGRPGGTLHEGAMDLVGRLVPEPTYDEWMTSLLGAQAYLHSLGITGWQDAIIGEYANISDIADVYFDAASSGRLTARVTGALWWHRDRGAEQIVDLRARRERLQAGRFRATSVKIMQDGIVENYTAGMLEPYLDADGGRTDNTGLSFVDPTALKEYVTALEADDFQVHVHAIGDRAVREALDAFAAAAWTNPPGDRRHHIAHIQVIHPDDVPRFAVLDVTANMQPLWAAHEPQMDELTLPYLGEPRASWQYPFAALRDAGVRLAAGSDWPVSSPNPLEGIHVAVNRRLPGDEPGAPVFLPEQRLDLATALTAYTAGSARVAHLDEAGAVEVGRVADLAVLDRDPFDGAPERIADTRVVATYVEGAEVFAK